MAIKYVKGSKHRSNNYGEFVILKYVTPTEIHVRFIETGTHVITRGSQIYAGEVKDPYLPYVFGVGFIGQGEYSMKSHKKLYTLWTGMLYRCYDEKAHVKLPTYIDCTVVKRWHNFQLFCKDIVKMKNWNVKGFQLDKDLRVPGNKKYGPKYCSFVPPHVNSIFNGKGDGVRISRGRYRVDIRIKNIKKFVASFTSMDEALDAYLQAKASYLKRLAKEYRDVLHRDVYRNLKNGAW